jgi:hypothetical protein
MKFYAYIPTEEGKEPIGSGNSLLFELKTVRGAINRSIRYLKTDNIRVYTYWNFYDDKTFRLVYGKENK